MFDISPESFNENIIKCPAPAIHADGNAFAFQHAGEGVACELRALITVEYFRLSMPPQGIFQAINTKPGLHGVTDPPAQYSP